MLKTDAILTRIVRRFAYIRPSNVETFAEHFVRMSKCTDIPREPENVLGAFGITLTGKGLKRGWSGHWHKTSDGYEVFINNHQEPTRRRFTAYHEAFEIISQLPSFPHGTLTEEQLHRMADLFAAAVLMPERELREAADELHHPEIDKTDVLAERFGVSISAMRIRLRQLKLASLREPWKHHRYSRLDSGNDTQDWEERGERDAQRFYLSNDTPGIATNASENNGHPSSKQSPDA